MNLRVASFLTALLAGSASARISEPDEHSKRFGVPLGLSAGQSTLSIDSYTGTYVIYSTLGPNTGRDIVLLDCAEGSCSGFVRVNVSVRNTPISESLGAQFGLTDRILGPGEVTSVLTIGPDGSGSQVAELPPPAFTTPASILPTHISEDGEFVTRFVGSFSAQSPLLPDGQTISYITTRREHADGFTNLSLAGTYSWSSLAGLNQGVYGGVVTFDGEGGFSGTLSTDEPDGANGRALSEGPLEGTYVVEDNGVVTMSQTGAGAPAASLYFMINGSGDVGGIDAHAHSLIGSWDISPPNELISRSGVTAVDLTFLGFPEGSARAGGGDSKSAKGPPSKATSGGRAKKISGRDKMSVKTAYDKKTWARYAKNA